MKLKLLERFFWWLDGFNHLIFSILVILTFGFIHDLPKVVNIFLLFSNWFNEKMLYLENKE